MPTEKSYEISSYRNGRWEILGSENDKLSAKDVAHHFLESNHHKKVRVIEETFDPITEEFTTKIVFSKSSSPALAKSIPDMEKAFRSGKMAPVSRPGHDVSEVPSEHKQPGQGDGRELINRLMMLVLIVGGVLMMLAGSIYFYLDVLSTL